MRCPVDAGGLPAQAQPLVEPTRQQPSWRSRSAGSRGIMLRSGAQEIARGPPPGAAPASAPRLPAPAGPSCEQPHAGEQIGRGCASRCSSGPCRRPRPGARSCRSSALAEQLADRAIERARRRRAARSAARRAGVRGMRDVGRVMEVPEIVAGAVATRRTPPGTDPSPPAPSARSTTSVFLRDRGQQAAAKARRVGQAAPCRSCCGPRPDRRRTAPASPCRAQRRDDGRARRTTTRCPTRRSALPAKSRSGQVRNASMITERRP